jgi:hypothetical protein
MIAKKLLVAAIVGTAMIFTANTQTAKADGPHVRVVARPVVRGYWGGSYYYPYTYPTVYAPPAPVVETPAVYGYSPYWTGGVYVAPRVGFRIGR